MKVKCPLYTVMVTLAMRVKMEMTLGIGAAPTALGEAVVGCQVCASSELSWKVLSLQHRDFHKRSKHLVLDSVNVICQANREGL